MNKKIIIILVAVVMIFAVVCGVYWFVKKNYQNYPTPTLILTDDTNSTPEGVEAIVNANNRFAFDLYSEYKSEKGNIFFSPYSISTALAMTYEGARGKTAEEMQAVLHIPEDAKIRRPNFAKIHNQINKANEKYELFTANALWAQENYQFLDEYFQTIEKYYGGKVTNLDFVEEREREKSRLIINNWTEKQTNNKIKDIIPKGVFDNLTRLVLTNAIYFKGVWDVQFDKKDTKKENFKTISGQTVKIPMMKLTDSGEEFNYADINGVKILELSYEGEDLSMLLVLPEENNLKNLENSITAEKLSEWKSGMMKREVDIYLPRFKFETKYFMGETLKKIGMPTAFSPMNADFSGMTGKSDLYIGKVIHQAFVEVNEEGTEAAAATAVVMESWGLSVTPVFRADHPFIFIIQQKETGNILFMGRVSNPNE